MKVKGKMVDTTRDTETDEVFSSLFNQAGVMMKPRTATLLLLIYLAAFPISQNLEAADTL